MEKESLNIASGKVVPHNSLSDMIAQKIEDQNQGIMGGGQTYCPKCDNLNRNILYLENYLRSSILKEPCNSCSTCLSFLQYMKQTMPEQTQQRKQQMQNRNMNTPILTDFYAFGEPESYMARAQKQQQSLPEFIRWMMPKKVMNTPSKKVAAPRRPRVVEFPMPGQVIPKNPPRAIYNKRAKAHKPAGPTKEKKVLTKKVPNGTGNFEGVPPPAKKMVKKKRAKLAKGAKSGNNKGLNPTIVK